MQISIGQKATRSITLTAEHVRTFAALSGDYNPLHFDESFVSKIKFSDHQHDHCNIMTKTIFASKHVEKLPYKE